MFLITGYRKFFSFLVTVLFLLSGTGTYFCFLDADVFSLSIHVLILLPSFSHYSVILLYDRYHVFAFWSLSCFPLNCVFIINFFLLFFVSGVFVLLLLCLTFFHCSDCSRFASKLSFSRDV